jgi:hypothetical protein
MERINITILDLHLDLVKPDDNLIGFFVLTTLLGTKKAPDIYRRGLFH